MSKGDFRRPDPNQEQLKKEVCFDRTVLSYHSVLSQQQIVSVSPRFSVLGPQEPKRWGGSVYIPSPGAGSGPFQPVVQQERCVKLKATGPTLLQDRQPWSGTEASCGETARLGPAPGNGGAGGQKSSPRSSQPW